MKIMGFGRVVVFAVGVMTIGLAQQVYGACEVDKQLHTAAAEGNNDELRRLLVLYHDFINVIDAAGRGVLSHAIGGKGDADTMKLLVEGKAFVDIRELHGGFTPLMCCARSKHNKIELAQVLIDAGASLDMRSKDGATALYFAVQEKNAPMFSLLLRAGANSMIPGFRNNLIPLAAALLVINELEMAQCLLDNGNADAQINVPVCDGNSLLWAIVAHNKNPAGAMALVLKYAPDQLNQQNKEGETPLMRAVISGDGEAFATLLEAKAIVDIQDKDGWTALLYAATANVEAVTRLLDAKAYVDKQTHRGATALSIAAERNRIPIMERLIEARASLELADRHDGTLLMRSAARGQVEAVELLLAAKACTDLSLGKHRFTPLFEAVVKGHMDIIRLLLRDDRDDIERQVRVRDCLGCTPLMRSIVNEVPLEITQELLAKGPCVIDEQDDNGKTALMIAAKQGNEAVVGLLLAAKASTSIKDRKGRTALWYARERIRGVPVKDLELMRYQIMDMLEGKCRVIAEMLERAMGEDEEKKDDGAVALAKAAPIVAVLAIEQPKSLSTVWLEAYMRSLPTRAW